MIWRALIVGCLIGVLISPVLSAQVIQGSILGIVSDGSGATIPGVEVTVRNQGTNVSRSMVTSDRGEYRIGGLEAGLYEVAAELPGFRGFRQTGVEVTLGQSRRVNIQLELGEVSNEITVGSSLSQIETESATVSNVKSDRDYKQLPLSIFGRGWANITNVTAGVQSKSGFEVNGARDTANNFTSDGISVNDITSSRNTANGFSGEIEMLQEVKIMTTNASAEYAQVAQFAAVSRSGSNDLHGSLYWGNFNSYFSARRWNSPTGASFTNHNMFAVTNGGPILIPGLYDGRDRTFYFFSYGGARYRIGNRSYVTLPTPAFRNGDFSSLLADSIPENDRIQLIDPLTGNPFPNNVIPEDRISPVSRALQDLIYPDPNLVGSGVYGLNQNFYGDPGGKFDSDVVSIRLDHNLTDSNALFFRTGITVNNKDTYPGILNSGFGQGSFQGNLPGRSFVISDTHTFGPTAVNEFKVGVNRNLGRQFDPNLGVDVVNQIGLEGIQNPGNDPAVFGMPHFAFNGAVSFHGTRMGSINNYHAENTYQVLDNLSLYRGAHILKMGVDVRRYQINDFRAPQSIRGQFSFDDRLSGFGYANFLLGYPSFARRTLPRPAVYPRSWQFGAYFQDDINVNPWVTVNLGLRYDYQTPWVEEYDRMFTFDPSTGNMVTAGSTIPDDLIPEVVESINVVSAAEAGFPERSLYGSDKDNWSPRVGIAIRPFKDSTTVVRAGYGLYTQIWPGLMALRATGGPWESNQDFILPDENVPSIQFPNPFTTTSEFSGIQTISGLNTHFQNERTQQWNISVGRQIWDMALDVGYVGTRAMNIPYTEDLNLLPPSTEPFDPARHPYPRFNSVNLTQTGGSSIYHGLNVHADRNFANGLAFDLNYTWAKALTDVNLRSWSASPQQNQYQRYLERGDDPNIRRQQLRFSYMWELPFGRGRRYGSGLPVWADHVLGGWQLNGITTLVTGQRLSPTFSSTDPANTNQFGGRPDRTGDGNLDSGEMRDRIKSGVPIFDSGAFTVPESGRGFYGNSARYILTGPGEALWNIVVAKNWNVANERARLQFRWEMFNAFNRPNFANPSTNIESGTFGVVTRAGAARSMLFGLRLDY